METIQEQFFTVREISAQLKIDRHVVTRLFENEQGVINIGRLETTGRGVRGGESKRRYMELRIPASVLNRVLTRRKVQ
ncbi:MAG: hypothetical protein ABSE40_25090 [Candidatus Sulfotelmatobacter sp.]